MVDHCNLCSWKDEPDCQFKPHECLETHMRMVHGVEAREWF